MVRRTSIDVYNKIKENGTLSKRRWEVYDILFHHGPLSAREVFNKTTSAYKSHTAGRLTELVQMNAAWEVQEDYICSVTGNRVILYDVTDRLPVKFEKPKRIKCQNCKGKGHIETQQARLF